MTRKVAIITGASSGLGKGTSRIFAEEGWNVVLAARSKAKLDELEVELRGVQGEVVSIPTNVADHE